MGEVRLKDLGEEFDGRSGVITRQVDAVPLKYQSQLEVEDEYLVSVKLPDEKEVEVRVKLENLDAPLLQPGCGAKSSDTEGKFQYTNITVQYLLAYPKGNGYGTFALNAIEKSIRERHANAKIWLYDAS